MKTAPSLILGASPVSRYTQDCITDAQARAHEVSADLLSFGRSLLQVLLSVKSGDAIDLDDAIEAAGCWSRSAEERIAALSVALLVAEEAVDAAVHYEKVRPRVRPRRARKAPQESGERLSESAGPITASGSPRAA